MGLLQERFLNQILMVKGLTVTELSFFFFSAFLMNSSALVKTNSLNSSGKIALETVAIVEVYVTANT